jgi:glycerate-2-kinase
VDFPLLTLLRRRANAVEKTRAVPHRIIGSNRDICRAAEAAATRRGLPVQVWPEFQVGEARNLATKLTECPFKGVLIAGGEPTVTIRGDGLGGRCQEMAATAARLGQGRAAWAFLAGSTDGTDGPTEVAGGVVNGTSVSRSTVDLGAALANNDSHRFLASCDGLLVTGPTGSNVNDLFITIDLA